MAIPTLKTDTLKENRTHIIGQLINASFHNQQTELPLKLSHHQLKIRQHLK